MAGISPGRDAGASATQLADELAGVLLDVHPLPAAALGLHDWDDKLPDHTEAADGAAIGRLRDIAARARAVDPAALDADRRLTLAMVVHQAEAQVDELSVRAVEYTVSDSNFGPVVELFSLMPMVGLTEQEHAEGYLARLAGIPELLAAIAERHRVGLGAGRLPVRDHVQATVRYLDRYLGSPDADPLRQPEPSVGGPVDRGAFRSSRDKLLAERVRPAVGAYRDVLAENVLPHGRSVDRGGMCWLPDGDDYYARLVRMHTTTERSPREWHDIGLGLVAALASEYAEIGVRALGSGDIDDIFARLRDDPALRWRDGAELLRAMRDTVDRAEQAAASWFGRLPDQGCTVEPIPAHAAPGLALAAYVPAALDGSRPGTFLVNTHHSTERNRTVAEATAFHEGVPGHHLQTTLATERTDLPLLRRLPNIPAYLEGWGLYSERLADEMGLYSDDLARLGMLTADSVRAARLVVDTGLHSLGWTRRQARDYLHLTTPMPGIEIDQETDRYIAAPGQALAYMAGRLEIQRLRADAERRLGGRFDIRAFHDTVLGSGPLPLPVLDHVVQAWVTDQTD